MFNVAGNLTLPNGKEGAYDYFILDYQSNVRMVVTEQQQSASNIATMETARAGQEAPVFGQTGPANELEASRFATPSAWNNATVGQQVSRLGTLSGHTLGPNTLQKVMAGDKISATVQYFYQATPGASSPISTVVLNTLGQLLSGTNSVSSIVKSNATAITSQLGANPGFIDAVQPTGAGGNIPQAYLTILFFDERFNFISAADGGVAQQQVAASVSEAGAPLGLGNIKAPKNGYAMVYVSNRSDQPVYFDNLQVGKVAGNILEENHYYAYGLRIAAISSRKFGDVSEGEIINQFLYNGKEMLDEDTDLGWIDYGFRNYDPQIGRFPQLDPLADDYPLYTPYQYAGNDPIANIDLDGLEPLDALRSLVPIINQAVINHVYKGLAEIIVTGKRVVKAASSTYSAAKLSYKVVQGLTTSWNFTKAGVGAIWDDGKGAVNFVTSGEILNVNNYTEAGKTLFAMGLGSQGGSGMLNLMQIDQYLGTDFSLRYKALNEGLDKTIKDIPNMDEKDWGAFIGHTTFALFGTKGLGAVGGGLKKLPLLSNLTKGENLLRGGKSFAQFKAARGGTETLAKISTSTGTQRISTEFHHVFLTQRMQTARNLPNWLVNNRLNVWKLNTIQHSLIDPFRFNFLRAGIKSDVSWFGKYNWFTKF